MKKRTLKKISFYSIFQSAILTTKYFFQNTLLSYSSSCSFDFLFSAIPILVLVVAVLVKILHTSPSTIKAIFHIIPELEDYVSPEKIIEYFEGANFFNPFVIFLMLFIIWMARKFFASIFASTKHIIHTRQKRKVVLNQILSLVFEIITIFTVIGLILVFFALEAILTLPFFQKIPQLKFIFNGFLSSNFISFLPNILIFVIITILYLGSSGTKPGFALCATSSFLCTLTFWIFRTCLHLFRNVSRYNLLYGVLSQVVILMMDIFFFFAFFLFFAQFIFVFQFLDELIFGELYLNSKKINSRFENYFFQKFFLSPELYHSKYSKIKYLKKNEIFLEKGVIPKDVFYISKGTVEISSEETGYKKFYSRGDFFCEVNCIFNQNIEFDVKALSDCKIYSISKENFLFLIDKNSLVAQKVLEESNFYFSSDFNF